MDIVLNVENREIVNIVEKLTIESKYIDSNIEKHLLEHLKKCKEKKCTKKYGFINHISKMKILDAEISMADSSNIFIIDYDAEIYKPMVGKKYTSSKTLHSQGTRIFLDVEGMFQILVVNGVVEKNKYIFENCNCKIDTDRASTDKLSNIKLQTVEFKDGKYVTIGEHVH